MQFGRRWQGKVVKVNFLGTKNKTAPFRYPPPPPSCALWGRRAFFWLWRFCVLCFFTALAFARAFVAFLCVLLRFPRSLVLSLLCLLDFFRDTLLLRLSSLKKSTLVLRFFPSLPDLVSVRSFVTLGRALELERLYFRCR
jgi:hypothetical protein